jgi:hypothetical protein
MNKVATSLTPSRGAGVEGPSIDELIAAGSLHQRLAAARAAREKALAASEGRPEQFLSGQKPWERPEYKRGEPRKMVRDRAASALTAPTAPILAPLILAERTVRAPATEAEPTALPVATVAAPVAQNRLRQVLGATAIGIGIGVGLGYWFAGNTLPDATRTIALSDEAPAVLRNDAGAQNAGIKGPAADVKPTQRDVPRLPPVTPSAATPPEIAGGGPVQRDAAIAPGLPEPDLMPDTGPATPGVVDQPRPSRQTERALPDVTGDARFAGLAALPGNAPIATIVAGLPVAEATLPTLPPAPETVATPVAWRMPDTVTLPISPADTPLAPQASTLPVSRPAPAGGLTLILHAPAALASTEVGAISGRLAAEGFPAPTSQAVDFTISQTNIRYFSPEDAKAAGAVATALNARLRDFTSFSPRPPAGTIEIWLAGQGSGVTKTATTAPTKAKKRRAAPVSAVDALKTRLIRQLRAGVLN